MNAVKRRDFMGDQQEQYAVVWTGPAGVQEVLLAATQEEATALAARDVHSFYGIGLEECEIKQGGPSELDGEVITTYVPSEGERATVLRTHTR
jgi:hypothetical protein